MAKYLDEVGLARLWSKTKSYIDTKTTDSNSEKIFISIYAESTGGGVTTAISTTITLNIDGVESTYNYNSTPISISVPRDNFFTIKVNRPDGYIFANAGKNIYKNIAVGGATEHISFACQPIETNVYIVDSTGNMIIPDDYKYGTDITGVALFTDTLSIIIAPEGWYSYSTATENGIWNGNSRSGWGSESKLISGCTTCTTISDARADFNGESNTDAIISQLKDVTGLTGSATYFKGAPAAEYCRAYSRGYKGVGEWYLPSAGECYVMGLNYDVIMNAFKKVDNEYSSNFYSEKWTSTQYDKSYAWKFYPYWANSSDELVKVGKTSYVRAHPICKY